ncbi:hypothetical protein EYZ11_012875 [Aspergillus tanneri]|uniref:Uncharacterized protein n=1 Tax=Aspergillus tanneri TaxID=1220188 RepID=A0A4S3J182_9EURO|nr:hypothetical protein EYZ11_012875 [Aspergillus tanneri]
MGVTIPSRQAVIDAYTDICLFPLTATDVSVLRLVDWGREVNWASDKKGKLSCVALPVLKEAASYSGACLNYIWNGRGSRCTLRTRTSCNAWNANIDYALIAQILMSKLRSDRLQKSPTAGASTGPSYILFGSRKGRLFDPSNTGQSSTPFRSKKSSLDGDFVPWSVPKNAWDNIKTLEIIRMELRRYLYIVNNRIEALNPREPSPNTFWDTVAESYKDIEVGLELDKLKGL